MVSLSTNQLVTSEGSRLSVAGYHRATDTGALEWAVVRVSRLDRKSRLVMLDGARYAEDGIHVPYTLAGILSAPSPRVATEIRADEEAALRSHYSGLQAGGALTAPSATEEITVVRSEERLHISRLEWRPYKRTRVRVVVREREVVQRVVIKVQELVVDDDPSSVIERLGMAGDTASQDAAESELVLHREEVTFAKRVVPYERVRIRKEIVSDTYQVDDELRKERVEIERRRARRR